MLEDSQCKLEQLYTILNIRMGERKLLINKKKSKCMVFKKRSNHVTEEGVEICSNTFEVVKKYRYLGHIIQDNLADIEDVGFRLNSFYAKFNWLFRSFKNVSIDVFYFLFKSFCVPDYGLPLWNIGEVVNRRIFKTFEIAFSNALKKMLGVPISTSNHAVAEIFIQLLFIHYVTLVQTRFYKRIFKSKNALIQSSRLILMNGYLFGMLRKRLDEIYSVEFFAHTLDILKARIEWIQRHEPVTGQSI